MRAEIRRHHDRVRALGCIITRRPHPTIHHCHGGSVRDVWGSVAAVGMAQRASDWLVIPLDADLHVGARGIDSGYGVRSWERDFGLQVDHLIAVNQGLPYDIFERAGLPNPEELWKSGSGFPTPRPA